MTELNGIKPLRVSINDGYSFKVWVDPTTLGEYIGGGIVEDVKVALPHKFSSLEESIAKPLENAKDHMFPVFDFAAFDRPGQLHIAFQAIQAFRVHHHRWPGDNSADSLEVIRFAEEINTKLGTLEGSFKLEAIDDATKTIITNASRFSHASIVPMTAFFGGIAAQEVVKLTGKYTPCT